MVILKKTIAISKYFFQKNLKDIVSFSIILFIATILFSSSFVLNNNVSKDYDHEFTRLNTASAFFIIPSVEYEEKMLEEIRNIKGIQDAEIQIGVMLSVSIDVDGKNQDQNQIFYNISDITNINKREIKNEALDQVDFGIYLSNYTFLHSSLGLKDEYEIEVDNIPYRFNIKGVVHEMQYGNYTSSVIGEYLENEPYHYLLQNNKDKEIVTISVIGEKSHSAYYDVSKYLSSKNIHVLSKNYKEQSKNGRLAISNILVLILMVFAGFMLTISLFVSKFKIEQTIEEEMIHMGVLKALGYTSNEIIVASIFPYIISGLLFTLLGIIISYFVLPTLSLVIEMQSGFIWKRKIDLLSNGFVLFINLSLIMIFTSLASFKIKKVNPINAIRGVTEKDHHKNYFEVEKTKGNIHFILMLKNFMNAKKQNILLSIALFFITIISSFVGILFYNINMNPINFINTLVEEHPSVVVSSNKDLRKKIKSLDNVKNVIYYDENVNANYQDNSYKTFVTENFPSLGNDLCYEGENPKNSNEVAIGSKIKETYHLKIGDDITLFKNGVENRYKIVGFVQSVNYAGEIIEMTLTGYQKLDMSYSPKTMYVYLENEKEAEKFIAQIKEQYHDDILSTMNYAESMDSAMNMYVSLIRIICVIIIVITLLLIYLILYIVISSIITRRKQELGILKAIGYENKELIRQLVGGFVPSTIIATMLGLLIGKICMNQIYTVIFKAVGAYKLSFEYPFVVFFMIVVILILSTMMIAIILAQKIKKVSVYSLIKE